MNLKPDYFSECSAIIKDDRYFIRENGQWVEVDKEEFWKRLSDKGKGEEK